MHGLVARTPALDAPSRLIYESLFVGLVVTYFLWGVEIAQGYFYYKSYWRKDPRWMKGAVGLILIIDALQSVLLVVYCWRIVIKLAGTELFDQPGGWTGYTVPFLDALTASIVHCIYAQKIWTLLYYPYNYICTATVLAFSCLQVAWIIIHIVKYSSAFRVIRQLVAGFGAFVFMSVINMRFDGLDRVKRWASIWLVTAAVTDILITTIITWKLATSRTGIKRTDDILTKLIRLIIETGLPAAIVQTVQFAIYLKWPLKPYQIIFAFLIPKVYSNSILALLNSRKARMSNELCCFCQVRPIDNIVIHTTRTVDISPSYAVGEHHISTFESIAAKGSDDDTDDPNFQI